MNKVNSLFVPGVVTKVDREHATVSASGNFFIAIALETLQVSFTIVVVATVTLATTEIVTLLHETALLSPLGIFCRGAFLLLFATTTISQHAGFFSGGSYNGQIHVGANFEDRVVTIILVGLAE